MITDLLRLDGNGLRRQLEAGHPIDPSSLDDSRYRGVSLGLPRVIDRILWKTFEKTFHRDGQRLRGWNVRLEQTGIDGDVRCLLRGGEPIVFGHYDVLDEGPQLVLDYGSIANPRIDPSRLLRDPLVALRAGDPEWLFGCTDVVLPGGRRWRTPSYFVLRRIGRLERRVGG